MTDENSVYAWTLLTKAVGGCKASREPRYTSAELCVNHYIVFKRFITIWIDDLPLFHYLGVLNLRG
jgi:hypothetical protein